MKNTDLIRLDGRPLSTNHVYATMCRGNFPSRYMTSKGKTLKESYQWQARQQFRKKPHAGELAVDVVLFFDSRRKHDIDNYHKISLDALTGIAWNDDDQITKMTVQKYYDKENPRIEIKIEAIEN